MERSTIFNGKIHDFYGHFQELFVGLPEGTANCQSSIDKSSWVTFKNLTLQLVEYCGVFYPILGDPANTSDTSSIKKRFVRLAVQSSLISLREVWGGTHVWGITIQSCVFSGFNMFMIGDCIPLQTTWLSGTACILFWDIFEWFKSASNQFAKTCATVVQYTENAQIL